MENLTRVSSFVNSEPREVRFGFVVLLFFTALKSCFGIRSMRTIRICWRWQRSGDRFGRVED